MFNVTRLVHDHGTALKLFTLLGTLLLHDCGHVIGKIEKPDGSRRRLYADEIRDHHHVLSYLRLSQPGRHGETGSWLIDKLTGDASEEWAWGDSRESVWENCLKSIATIGVYHRQKMKLSDADPRPDYVVPEYLAPYTTGLGSSLRDVGDLRVFGEQIRNPQLVAALLSVIDGMDQQSSRVGSRQDKEFHLALVEMEQKDEQERIKDFAIVLEKLDPGLKNEIDRGFDSKAKDKLLDLRNVLNSVAENHVRIIAEEYVLAKNKEEFKAKQRDHYEEKDNIRGVLIKDVVSEDGGLEIRITLDLYNRMETGTASKVLLGMEEEYKRPGVQEVFEANGIVLKYIDVLKARPA